MLMLAVTDASPESAAFADVILLKSGGVVRGELIGDSRRSAKETDVTIRLL